MFIWALLFAAAVSSSNGAAPRIIGGEPVSIMDYPSAVQVEFRNVFLWWSQTCAGTIISPRFVISTAQCFTGFLFSINQRRIRCGTSTRDSGGYTVDIVRATNHWSFRTNRYEGDITILQLESRLNYGLGINAAVLPTQGFEMFPSAPVTMLGWGTMRINGGGPSSETLRRAQVLTVQHEECVERYNAWPKRPSDISTNMLCVGLLDVSERDSCDGDAGGPILFNSDVLVGIISWGRTCGNAYFPRVGTKVSPYIDWIYETIGSGDW